jgi:hypothetical protein
MACFLFCIILSSEKQIDVLNLVKANTLIFKKFVFLCFITEIFVKHKEPLRNFVVFAFTFKSNNIYVVRFPLS